MLYCCCRLFLLLWVTFVLFGVCVCVVRLWCDDEMVADAMIIAVVIICVCMYARVTHKIVLQNVYFLLFAAIEE